MTPDNFLFLEPLIKDALRRVARCRAACAPPQPACPASAMNEERMSELTLLAPHQHAGRSYLAALTA